MAHAFESIEHYEEFALQCEVQASFATSPAEREYFVKQAATFRHLAGLRAPQTSKAAHASRFDRARQTGQQEGSLQESTFYEIAG
jgi:hypothetical protein